MPRGLPLHPSCQYFGTSENNVFPGHSGCVPSLRLASWWAECPKKGGHCCCFSFSAVSGLFVLPSPARPPSTAANWTKGICPHKSTGGLGITSLSLLRSRFGLIKLIHVSGPTKWRPLQRPSPVTNLSLGGLHLWKTPAKNPNVHQSESSNSVYLTLENQSLPYEEIPHLSCVSF